MPDSSSCSSVPLSAECGAHRAIFRRVPAALHSLDAEFRIADVSDDWLTLLGYELREEVVGRQIFELQTPDSARFVREVGWPQLLAEGEIRDLNLRFVRKDGRTVDVLLSSRLERDADGSFLRTVSVLTDVSIK